MDVTATEATNRLGQMLEAAQRRPSGAAPVPADPFDARDRDGVDRQRTHFDKHGIWNEELHGG